MNPDDERKSGRPLPRAARRSAERRLLVRRTDPAGPGDGPERRSGERRDEDRSAADGRRGAGPSAVRAGVRTVPSIDVGAPDPVTDRRAGPSLDADSTLRGRQAPTPEERRETLRSMLELADGRRARAAARRRERPVMASGVAVQVVGGARSGALARIVDADYIANRVLVRLDGSDERVWVGFGDVAVPIDPPAGDARDAGDDGIDAAVRSGLDDPRRSAG